jgi:hypothetical protein
MAKLELKAQIQRDSEKVSQISPAARDIYCRELKATLDRGAIYRFQVSGNSANKVSG